MKAFGLGVIAGAVATFVALIAWQIHDVSRGYYRS